MVLVRLVWSQRRMKVVKRYQKKMKVNTMKKSEYLSEKSNLLK